jgi:hypothetical protein
VRAPPPHLSRHARNPAEQPPSPRAEGTGSTPGVLQVPQMGFVSFRCDRAFRVQPFFDTHGSTNGDDVVTVRARRIVRRNFTTRVVRRGGKTFHETTLSSAPLVALPYGHYRRVTFEIHEGSEARILDATVSAEFVAGTVASHPGPPLHACYVKRWLLSLTVR